MKRKTLLAGGILRDIEFLTKFDYEIFIDTLNRQHRHYEILDKLDRPSGSVIVRILTQYNAADLIQL